MMRDLALVALGVGLCGLALLAWEVASRLRFRSRQKGNYRDARQPFRIVAPPPYEERSEELIAREARRLIRKERALPVDDFRSGT